MSIRLRTVDGIRVALCAVESNPKPGDTYLDDSDHLALHTKFALDSHGAVTSIDPTIKKAMETQKIRDAKEDIEKMVDEETTWHIRRIVKCG